MDRWSKVGHAIACRLEWERLCDRGDLIDEASLVRAAAEVTQALSTEVIVPEWRHPDLKGYRQVDLVGKGRSKKVKWALEAKWVCTTRGTREWDREVAVDICRLQHLTSGLDVKPLRFLLVAGPSAELRAGLLEKQKNIGKKRMPILAELLPMTPGTLKKYNVRGCADWLHPFFSNIATDLGAPLPSTYDATLVGQFAATQDTESISVCLWMLNRPRGWGSFDPSSEWQLA
jgi:hypothetical protein